MHEYGLDVTEVKLKPTHHLDQSINLCLNERTNPCFDKSYCREVVLERGGRTKTVTCEACPPGYKGNFLNLAPSAGEKCLREKLEKF